MELNAQEDQFALHTPEGCVNNQVIHTTESSICNPLVIEGYPVLGRFDSTTDVNNVIERVVRESMECTTDPSSVKCVFQVGRLVGITQNRAIVLPVETELILENDTTRISFIPDVSPKLIDTLYLDVFTSQAGDSRLVSSHDCVEVEVVTSQNIDHRKPGDDLEGFHHIRIYRVPYDNEDGLMLQQMECWEHNILNNLLVYRPHSQHHYRIQTASTTVTHGTSTPDKLGNVLKLSFRHMRNYKTSPVGPEKLIKWELNVVDHWDIVVNEEMANIPIESLIQCFTTCLVSKQDDTPEFSFLDRDVVDEGRRHYIQLCLQGRQLVNQFQRMVAFKRNRFGYILSLVRSNLCMILDRFDKTSVDIESTGDFYPNRFGDTAEVVQLHYDTRKLVRQKGSAVEALRRHNNLVKRILIACYIHRKSTVLDLACGHCQDLDKYATVGIKQLTGIDISLSEIMEARRRYSERSSSRRIRFRADFHHGNLLEEKIYGVFLRNRKFDVVTMQLAIHYIISDEANATMLLRNIHQALGDKGIFIGSTVCCNAIAKGLNAKTPYQASDDGPLRWEFGNSIFRVTVDDESMDSLMDPVTNKYLSGDALVSHLETHWGIKYHFFLMESIDASEYVVPWKAFTELCVRLGFRLIETFTFPEYLDNAPTILNNLSVTLPANVMDNLTHHIKQISSLNISPEQQEAFMLYRTFVFEKISGRDKLYMQGVKIRRTQ
ncbi:mRNA capping enzyme large subunit family protein [Babesia bovis T2Bo]|uniref:mRNA (guanine-N(7))-methyltransferase n=1 Tax=Babesia bovis TaxID=5865 RepID=A7ANR2_BABBO|nr:mRNA capping enzyme large subunit family protein [Babesia bovis T2Bo]EDO08196.1 mRNA capping enzyme large subunit family protein [Babesia bovis T2Bo]|eukprot:XP_001611764.1 mRNA capping enzyme, large subunit family protein [Babesia bovis T2Bo]